MSYEPISKASDFLGPKVSFFKTEIIFGREDNSIGSILPFCAVCTGSAACKPPGELHRSFFKIDFTSETFQPSCQCQVTNCDNCDNFVSSLLATKFTTFSYGLTILTT